MMEALWNALLALACLFWLVFSLYGVFLTAYGISTLRFWPFLGLRRFFFKCCAPFLRLLLGPVEETVPAESTVLVFGGITMIAAVQSMAGWFFLWTFTFFP